jgi:hypothetical protein
MFEQFKENEIDWCSESHLGKESFKFGMARNHSIGV